MSTKKLILISIVVLSLIYYFNLEKNVDKTVSDQVSIELSNTKMINDINTIRIESKDEINDLENLAMQISPLREDEIKNKWESEFGCSYMNKCVYSLLNAKSLEEALWMKRKGYLSKSILDQLDSIDVNKLAKLANTGNINATKLMAIKAIRSGNIEHAKGFATNAMAHERNGETFSLRLAAEAYLLEQNPMLATVELRMAAILGDSDAAIAYERLTENSARSFIDHVNTLAYNYLSAKFKKPMTEWDTEERPSENGGG